MPLHRKPSQARPTAQEAWCMITDHFQTGQPFTLQDVLNLCYPGVTPNNYPKYLRPLIELFNECHDRTAEEFGVPHVKRLPGKTTMKMQRWVLPSEPDAPSDQLEGESK